MTRALSRLRRAFPTSARRFCRPRIEALENRRLLAGAPAFYWKLDHTAPTGGDYGTFNTEWFDGKGHTHNVTITVAQDHETQDDVDKVTGEQNHFDIALTGAPTTIVPGQTVQLKRVESGTVVLGAGTIASAANLGGDPGLLAVRSDPMHPGSLLPFLLLCSPSAPQPPGPQVTFSWVVPGEQFPKLTLDDDFTTYFYVLQTGTPPPPPISNFTWSGNGNGTWSDPKDWVGNVAPKADQIVDTLVFPAAAKNLSNTDDIAGLKVTSLQINGAYTLKGTKALTLTNNLAVNSPGATCNVSMPVKLDGAVTALVKAGEVNFGGVIGGTGGLTMVGPGTLDLGAINTYTGNTFLVKGTLKVVGNAPVGFGTLVLDGGTLTAGAGSEVHLANSVIINGNVAIAGVSSGVGITGDVKVIKTSVLTMSTSAQLSFAKSLSVLAPFVLSVQGGNPVFVGAVSGHVQLVGAGGVGPTLSNANLAPGAVLDFLKGTKVAILGALSGSGAINVAGGTLTCSDLSNLSSFKGNIFLQPGGTIQTSTTLGTGQLLLKGGTLKVDRNVNLTNAKTTLFGPVLFQVPKSTTLGFHGAVTVSADVTETLQGGSSAGSPGGVIDFFQNIGFNGNDKLVLTFAGSGTVRLHSLTPQVQKKQGSSITLTNGG